jgi:uncharacterized protein involved in type VI secretion and phage assembly
LDRTRSEKHPPIQRIDATSLLAPWVDEEVRRQAASTGYGNAFEAIRAHVPWRPALTDDAGKRLNST